MLWVRHQAHDVARLVDHACDIGDRTVRVVLVAEEDLAACLYLLAQLRRGEPGTRARLVWDPEFNVVLANEPTLEPAFDKELTS